MTPLPPLAGVFDLSPIAINANGASVVGRGMVGAAYHAILWNSSLGSASGVVGLNTYLPPQGVDLTRWGLTVANGVSFDGRTIVGDGTHNGRTEAWVATLPRCGSADFNHDGDAATDA